MSDNSEAIQQATDKDLIKKYTQVCMGLAKKLDKAELQLKELSNERQNTI